MLALERVKPLNFNVPLVTVVMVFKFEIDVSRSAEETPVYEISMEESVAFGDKTPVTSGQFERLSKEVNLLTLLKSPVTSEQPLRLSKLVKLPRVLKLPVTSEQPLRLR